MQFLNFRASVVSVVKKIPIPTCNSICVHSPMHSWLIARKRFETSKTP